jgi:AcrR family transcriptional regulator
MAESCAARGYERTTIDEVCAAAGVSRRSFDELFAGREDCLGAAMESLVEEARRRIESACSPAKPWAATVRDGARALLDLLAERPAFAHLALIEAPAAGGRAAMLYASGRQALESFIERGRDQELEEKQIPATAGRAALSGAESLIAGQILTGNAGGLPKLLPGVVYLLTVPYLGQGEALRQAQGPASPPGLRVAA